MLQNQVDLLGFEEDFVAEDVRKSRWLFHLGLIDRGNFVGETNLWHHLLELLVLNADCLPHQRDVVRNH